MDKYIVIHTSISIILTSNGYEGTANTKKFASFGMGISDQEDFPIIARQMHIFRDM